MAGLKPQEYIDDLREKHGRLMREDGSVWWELYENLAGSLYNIRDDSAFKAAAEMLDRTTGLMIKDGVLTAKPPYWALCKGKSLAGVNPSMRCYLPSARAGADAQLYFGTLGHARDYASALYERDIPEIGVLHVMQVEDALVERHG